MTDVFDRMLRRQRLLRLSEEDPQLFEGVRPDRRAEAGRTVTAEGLDLGPGSWSGELPGGSPMEHHLGLFVVDGLLLRNVTVAQRPLSELVGAGDLLRPWQHEGDVASIPFSTSWKVLEPTRLAILDDRFLATACRWPELMSSLVGRALRRSHALAVQLAIADLRRAEDRLVMLFWQLADRWGTVGPDGVNVPIRLTHDIIAQLVCAQRPTVTAALRRLDADGTLRRRRDRTWLLDRQVPAAQRRFSEPARVSA